MFGGDMGRGRPRSKHKNARVKLQNDMCTHPHIYTSGVIEHKYRVSLPIVKSIVLLLHNLYFNLVHAKQYNSS